MPDLHLKLQQKFPQAVPEVHAEHGDETAYVLRENFLEAARFLKEDEAMDMNVLMDLTAVDGLWMDWSPRFELVCHFYSMTHNHRLRLKVRIPEKDARVASLITLWPVANWFEREVWDMFGIKFEGHPDLKRILLYEEFTGHPLRKDYPINKRQPILGPGSRTPVPNSGPTS
jgi:NADH-quinone oxidoreductase subunit C